MKILSNASIYGMRALIYLASKKSRDEYVSIKEMSEKMDISFHFLTKTLQTLTKKGILQSYRGPSGGVALARSPESIYMLEIVKVLEGENFFDTCFLGLPDCGDEKPCPMHEFWAEVKEKFKDQFADTSLMELSYQVNEGIIRI